MAQKDLKIGLVLGLVLVIVAVLVLATDPRLSTKTRMLHLQDVMAKTKHSPQPNDDSLNAPARPVAPRAEESGEVPNPARQENLIQNEPSKNKTMPELNTINPENMQIIDNELSEPADVPQFDPSEKIKTERFYIVRKDQTLSDISRIYYGSPNQWKKIFNANRNVLKDANKIKPGIKLIIPE